MADIILATVNAKFQHAAFGLRYLLANLGELRSKTQLLEWSLGVRERDVVEQILEQEPKIVGLSVYIWNVESLTHVAHILKSVRPDVKLVIGGPEVSFEWETTELFQLCDFLVKGEGDLVFAELCHDLLAGVERTEKVVLGGLPPLSEVAWPYREYSDFDLEHGRIVYVEASRGCPFQCHFCLSSLDKSVRTFELVPFLEQMERLLSRGVLKFKFVDRTFNLKASTSLQILQFFKERYRDGMFLHFEMIPDRLPDPLKDVIAEFPDGVLQFEVGIQSFNQDVCARIGRRQNFEALRKNLTFLKEQTGVHVHADLIAGLPGEDLESFARGFDELHGLGVAEIQVGILKRLKGTPITLADEEWEMTYSARPPYEVLRTSHLHFQELQRLQRFARYWDLVANSSRFPGLCGALLSGGSPFSKFLKFSDWLFREIGLTHGISAKRLGECLVRYLGTREAPRLWKSDRETWGEKASLPQRQARRLAATATKE